MFSSLPVEYLDTQDENKPVAQARNIPPPDRESDNVPADNLFLGIDSLGDFEHVSKVFLVDRHLVCGFRVQNGESGPDFDLIVSASTGEGPDDAFLRVFSPEVVVEDRKERARLEFHGQGRSTAEKWERNKYRLEFGSKC